MNEKDVVDRIRAEARAAAWLAQDDAHPEGDGCDLCAALDALLATPAPAAPATDGEVE